MTEDQKDTNLTEILRKATEQATHEVEVSVLVQPSVPEDYAPVSNSVPPEAKDMYRQLTAHGEGLARYYEAQADQIIKQAEAYAQDLRKLASQIRMDALEEALRMSKFTKRIFRLGDTLSASWKDNPEEL